MINYKKNIAILTLLFASISTNASLIIGDPSAGGNWYPFGGGSASSTDNWGATYQMQFDSSLFSSDMTIDTLRFYNVSQEPGGTPGNGTYTLSLSTASGALSSDVASNFGADNTIVYTGALSLNGTFLDFDITDFFYDISVGDLLLTVTATGNTNAAAAFFASNSGDEVERLYRNVVSSSGWLTTGFNQFTVNEVDEPSVLVILSLALFTAGLRRQKK